MNAVFWLLVIIPIYEVFLVVDIVVLNLIEFWSGGDPMSMDNDDMEPLKVSFTIQKIRAGLMLKTGSNE